MSTVQWKPADRPALITSLIVDGAKAALDWYQSAMGATLHDRSLDDSGDKVLHSTLTFGEDHSASMIFVNDPFPGGGYAANSGTATFYLYVKDVDSMYERVTAAGAKGVCPPKDEFWGDRSSHVIDPFGVRWAINTHVKDLTGDEVKAAAKEWMDKHKANGGQAC
jgi:uncharacterized glyoxalase superfamily protein PhnB